MLVLADTLKAATLITGHMTNNHVSVVCTSGKTLFTSPQCVVPENFHTHPTKGEWKFLRGWGLTVDFTLLYRAVLRSSLGNWVLG